MSGSLVGRGKQLLFDKGPTELGRRTARTIINKQSNIFYNSILSNISSAMTKKELISYCRRKGEIYTHDSCPSNVQNISLVKRSEEYHPYHIDTSPTLTCEVPNGYVIGEQGLAMTGCGQPILESISPWPVHFEKAVKDSGIVFYYKSVSSSLISPLLGTTESETRHFDSAINLIPTVNDGYGHWLLDELPKLYYLSEYENTAKPGSKPKIIINSNPPDWMIDSIKHFGYGRDRIVIQDDRAIKAEKLIIPIHDRKLSPIPFRWLRNKAVENVSPSENNRRVFFSRQGLTSNKWSYETRKIKNFEEVKNVLDEFDFEVIRPEKLSIYEQIELLSDADLIVGIYGSALHNMIFSNNTNIIEILHPNHPFYANFVLSILSNNRYHKIKGDIARVDEYAVENSHPRDHPLSVSPQTLKTKIQQLVDYTHR